RPQRCSGWPATWGRRPPSSRSSGSGTTRPSVTPSSATARSRATPRAAARDARQQAPALPRAARFLAAAELYHGAGQDDEAIAALQQVDAQSADFAGASAPLGEIFLPGG